MQIHAPTEHMYIQLHTDRYFPDFNWMFCGFSFYFFCNICNFTQSSCNYQTQYYYIPQLFTQLEWIIYKLKQIRIKLAKWLKYSFSRWPKFHKLGKIILKLKICTYYWGMRYISSQQTHLACLASPQNPKLCQINGWAPGENEKILIKIIFFLRNWPFPLILLIEKNWKLRLLISGI